MLIPDFEGIVIQLGSEKSQIIMRMQLLSGGQGVGQQLYALRWI